MRVGWDLDGSGQHNFHARFNWIRRQWGEPECEYTDWHFYRSLGMTDQDFKSWCDRAADAGLLFGGEPFEGAVEAMALSRELGHTNVIITDREFGSTREVSQRLTIANLDEYGFAYDEIHFDKDKTKYDVDMMIEDRLENYDALIDAGVDAYLVDGPQNAVQGGDARKRIKSVVEFGNLIELNTLLGYADLTLV